MTTGAERIRKHREKMKVAGFKPVTIWVPDVNTLEYQAKIDRACRAINASKDSQMVLDGMPELADFSDWK